MSSDPSIGVSLGTAHVLGLTNAPCDAPPTTAYLLAGGRCAEDCAFCGQARSSTSRPDALSRVVWPAFPEERALDAVAGAWAEGRVQRACLQVTAGAPAVRETARLAGALRARAAVPVCAAVYPRTEAELESLLDAGIEVAGFGLDAAAPEVYAAVKAPGKRAGAARAEWSRRLEFMENAARQHPGRIGVHLIAGLGETERQMVELMDRLLRGKIVVALFAFTPVRGTALGHRAQPSLPSYRRLQAARHLLAGGSAVLERFTFDGSGAIAGYGLAADLLRAYLADGAAFRTSGCPGCNRPYYNERPGGTIYNYPRPLSGEEIRSALAALGL